MAKFKITSPDGGVYMVTAPEDATHEQVMEYAQQQFQKEPAPVEEPDSVASGIPNPLENIKNFYTKDAPNIAMGALKGASDIGATLMTPVDRLMGKSDRRQQLNEFFNESSDTDSGAFKVGEIGAGIAGTAGVGGVIGKGVMAGASVLPKAAPALSNIATAIKSGGMATHLPATGMTGKIGNTLLRAGGGAVNGGVAAGMIDPESAGGGAVIGGAIPVVGGAFGAIGNAIRRELNVTPEVAVLAEKARQLGVDVPVDRLTNSAPLNAVASSLKYVPFSGRAGAEKAMESQLNRALSRTFGQDSDNITMALRKAGAELNQKFDMFLKSNQVHVDEKFMNEMVEHMQRAETELSAPEAKLISNQIDSILNKATDGVIDGQAAYNIKKTLDRIGGRNSNEAWYATQLKKSLMGALERSVGSERAEGFSVLRRQYGNMLDLEPLAKNGAEGDISIARLSNMRNINNQELQDVADIAAQFVRAREGQHGAAQRIAMGAAGAVAGGLTGTLPMVGAGVAASRLANALLNSGVAKNALVASPRNTALAKLLKSAPVVVSPAVLNAQINQRKE